jgi:signal transduction histidine kinase/CheY-like chemotaxis protein/HPt (histidine-containing phosphotransfer) domain-containing protein
MSWHSKLVFSILALSVLGLLLLSSVLYDSYRQSSMGLQRRDLAAHSLGIAQSLSWSSSAQACATESLLNAARPFVAAGYLIFLVDHSGKFHPVGKMAVPGGEVTQEELFGNVVERGGSGVLSRDGVNFAWSAVGIPGSEHVLVLIHQEEDTSIENFVREFGVPLFVTMLVFLWITTWTALILGALFKKLDRQKVLFKEQAEKLAEAHEKALKASMAKGSFLANMSHEIRTPLTAIIGFSESLLGSDQSLEERISSIKTINHSGKHLLHVINEILDISKIEAEKLEIDLMQVSTLQLVNEIEPLMAMQASEKGLAFDVNYDFPIPETFTTDPTRLKQILINLVSNAIKFTEKGSIQVNVGCDREKQQMRFVVIDTGIGMTAEQCRNVFQAFSQADVSTTRKYGGTGLGLTLSQQLSEMLGGSLSVQSVPGVGSRFTAFVDTGPLDGVEDLQEIVEVCAESDVAPRTMSRNSVTGRVLIAEDNQVNQRLLDLYITTMGATTSVAENGQQAVEHASSAEFDLILMDMQMPVMSGVEATEELRRRGYKGKIIALTANTTPEDRELCLRSGCDDFLPKPIDRERFVETVSAYLKPVTPADGEPPIVSNLLQSQPDLAHLVAEFVDFLPAKIDALSSAAREKDWETLKDEAHQLKGVGGGYGYPGLTELAGKLEFQIISRNSVEVDSLVLAMDAYCRRIYAGASEAPVPRRATTS